LDYRFREALEVMSFQLKAFVSLLLWLLKLLQYSKFFWQLESLRFRAPIFEHPLFNQLIFKLD
jgi:hypothetical protein